MDSRETVEYLSQLGFRLFFWERQGDPNQDWKRALGKKNWNRRDIVEDISRYNPDKHNVGSITGYEIAPNKYLADVDIDWYPPPSLLGLLPPSAFSFGRPSKPISHIFYTTPERLPSVKEYKDVDGLKFLELFGGDFSQYTMVPPSMRSPSEPLQWWGKFEGTERVPRHIEIEDLHASLRNYAIATVLYRNMGHRAVLHQQRLAIAGFLLKEGLPQEAVNAIGRAVVLATANDLGDWQTCFDTTKQNIEAGKKTLGKTAIVELLGDKGKKVVATIKKLIGNSEFVTDQHGKVLADNSENIRTAIEKLDVRLFFDSFSDQPLCQNGGPAQLLDDYTRIPLRFKIEEHFHFRPSNELFSDILMDSALRVKVHPVRAYLDTLKWDGTPRVDTWLIDLAGAPDTPFVRSVSAKVLLAAVRRVREPGCKFDEMLILESSQGKAKSTAIRTLCPNPDWFSDGLPLGVDAQKVVEQTTGKWIMEASELHGNRGKEVEALKAFLSRGVDGPVRLAYHRLATQRARQFIIIGTTNAMTGYLKDSTGGRRFWPVRIKEFDVKRLAEIRDQLWAEAAQRESEGASIRLEEELWEAAAVEQEARRAADDWEDVIEDMVNEADWVPSAFVWERLGIRTSQQAPALSNRMSDIMQRFGFNRKVRLYVVVVVDGKESKAKQMTCWIRESFQEYQGAVRWVSDFENAYEGQPEKFELGGL